MKLSKEERAKELELLKELKDYCLEENRKMIAKENGPIIQRIAHKFRTTFHLYPKYEKRIYAMGHFSSIAKYLSLKHGISNQSITMEMIDAETPKSLKKGSRPYVNHEQKIRAIQKKLKEKTF